MQSCEESYCFLFKPLGSNKHYGYRRAKFSIKLRSLDAIDICGQQCNVCTLCRRQSKSAISIWGQWRVNDWESERAPPSKRRQRWRRPAHRHRWKCRQEQELRNLKQEPSTKSWKSQPAKMWCMLSGEDILVFLNCKILLDLDALHWIVWGS